MTYGDYIVQAETETDTKACTYEQVQCPKWWDMWQQYAYMQLSSASKNGQIAFLVPIRYKGQRPLPVSMHVFIWNRKNMAILSLRVDIIGWV